MVTGRQSGSNRVVDFIDSAEEETVHLTIQSLLTEDIVNRLQSPTDSDVAVNVAGISELMEVTIRDQIPDVEVFDPLGPWSEALAGRHLMIDKIETLISVLTSEIASASLIYAMRWPSGESE